MTFSKTTLFAAAIGLAPTIALAESSEAIMPPLYVEYAAQIQLSEPVHAAALPLAADVLAIDASQSLAVSGVLLTLALLALWLFRGQVVEFTQ